MNLDVTDFLATDEMHYISGSRFEFGDDAGRFTWNNALHYALENQLLQTDADFDHARDYFAEFGAWSKKELAEMTGQELNALLFQFVAGEAKEAFDMIDRDGYRAWKSACESGRCGGNLYRYRRRWFFNFSH
jgi:hypothetical protein